MLHFLMPPGETEVLLPFAMWFGPANQHPPLLCGDTIKETGIYYLKAERYTVAAGFMSHRNIYKACESTLLKSPMPFICQSHDFHWLAWRMISLMFMTN